MRMSPILCSLSCPWEGTESCVIHHAREAVRKRARLSLGQLAGLKSLYYPHALPPCVTAAGRIRLSAEEEPVPGERAVELLADRDGGW